MLHQRWKVGSDEEKPPAGAINDQQCLRYLILGSKVDSLSRFPLLGKLDVYMIGREDYQIKDWPIRLCASAYSQFPISSQNFTQVQFDIYSGCFKYCGPISRAMSSWLTCESVSHPVGWTQSHLLRVRCLVEVVLVFVAAGGLLEMREYDNTFTSNDFLT